MEIKMKDSRLKEFNQILDLYYQRKSEKLRLKRKKKFLAAVILTALTTMIGGLIIWLRIS